MVLLFILIILFIAIFIKLGMYSVWTTVLYAGIKVALLIIVALIVIMIWNHIVGKKRN